MNDLLRRVTVFCRVALLLPALLIVAALLLISCASFQSPTMRLAQVDKLVSEHEYGKALRLLENLRVDQIVEQSTSEKSISEQSTPISKNTLASRKASIIGLIDDYARNRVDESKKQQKDENWSQALLELNLALEKIPENPLLEKARGQFMADRQKRYEDLQRQLSLLQSEYLPQYIVLQAKVDALDSEKLSDHWNSFVRRRQLNNLAQALLQCGREALDDNDVALAKKCLKKVPVITEQLELQKDAGLNRQWVELRSVLTTQKQKKVERKKQLQERKATRDAVDLTLQKKEYQDLLESGWWLAARDKLSRLQAQAPEDSDIRQWTAELQKLIDSRIDLGIKQGESLYSRGYLREALSVWQQTSELAPKNQALKDHITRVEHFLNKLDRLDGSEPQATEDS